MKYLFLISYDFSSEQLLEKYFEGDDKAVAYLIRVEHPNTKHMPEELSRQIAESYAKARAYDDGYSSYDSHCLLLSDEEVKETMDADDPLTGIKIVITL